MHARLRGSKSLLTLYQIIILKQIVMSDIVRLTFMSVSSKCMNAFHSNFHLTNWSFRNDLHLRVIHLIIILAADKAVNTSTLQIKSQNINSLCVLCVRHNSELFKHI